MTEPESIRTVDMWSRPETISLSMRMVSEARGIPMEGTISTWLHNAGRVIVKNDPVIANAFGQDFLDRYEAALTQAAYED